MVESIGVFVESERGSLPSDLEDLLGYEGFNSDWVWARLDAAYEVELLAGRDRLDEVLSELYAESRDRVAAERVLSWTGVIEIEDMRRPSGEDYPMTWDVLGKGLDAWLEAVFSDVEQPGLGVAVEVVERVVDALESSLVDVQRMQVRVSEAEASQLRGGLKPVTVGEATRFRWHFLVDGKPVFLVPFSTFDVAKQTADAFLELWKQQYPTGNARSVVSDFGVFPDGEVRFDSADGGVGESDD